MKRKQLPILLLSAVMLAGCSGTGTPATDPAAAAETTIAEETTAAESSAEIIPNTVETVQETVTTEADEAVTDPYAGLTLNQYEGLEMTAAILPRNAIIPGSTVPVTIVITNTGEQTVSYVQGSGSFTTPQALHMEISDLQPILPEDHLGAATMDYVVKELKPGESLNYVMNIKTIKPSENFDNYTYDLFNKEQAYIGEMDIAELFETYDDLEPAVAGPYEGTATFVYYLADDSQAANVFGEATGYVQAPVTISVTE